ncbi:hypothetical protein ABBQ32_012437 [Trebouxia sp. C0010 RCD-2024]
MGATRSDQQGSNCLRSRLTRSGVQSSASRMYYCYHTVTRRLRQGVGEICSSGFFAYC